MAFIGLAKPQTLRKYPHDNSETERICTKCGGDPQPIENFGKKSNERGGRCAICKTCVNKASKKHYEERKADRRAFDIF